MPITPSSSTSLKPDPQTQIHAYTLCSHTHPPANRPLDVQPILDPTTGDSTISGRCPKCDQVFRRETESAILTKFGISIHKVELQRGVFDKSFLDHQIAELYKSRDEEVAKVWKGFARKWGPACVGKMDNGRTKLAWERPERAETEKTREKTKEGN